MPCSSVGLALRLTLLHRVTAQNQGLGFTHGETLEDNFYSLKSLKKKIMKQCLFAFHTLQARTYAQESKYILGLNTLPLKECWNGSLREITQLMEIILLVGVSQTVLLSCPRSWKCTIASIPHQAASAHCYSRGASTASFLHLRLLTDTSMKAFS